MHEFVNIMPSLIAIGIAGVIGLIGLAAAGSRRPKPVPIPVKTGRRR